MAGGWHRVRGESVKEARWPEGIAEELLHLLDVCLKITGKAEKEGFGDHFGGGKKKF